MEGINEIKDQYGTYVAGATTVALAFGAYQVHVHGADLLLVQIGKLMAGVVVVALFLFFLYHGIIMAPVHEQMPERTWMVLYAIFGALTFALLFYIIRTWYKVLTLKTNNEAQESSTTNTLTRTGTKKVRRATNGSIVNTLKSAVLETAAGDKQPDDDGGD